MRRLSFSGCGYELRRLPDTCTDAVIYNILYNIIRANSTAMSFMNNFRSRHLSQLGYKTVRQNMRA